MYNRVDKISAFFYSPILGHNIWANGTILGPAEILVTDIIRDVYRVQLDNGHIINKISADCIDAPIYNEL